MKTKLYTFLLSSLLCTGALADNERGRTRKSTK